MHLKNKAKKNIPIFLNYGGAAKFVSEMNKEELRLAQESILKRAKEKAFSKGLPIYYSREGKLMAEYSDGHIIIVGE